MAEEWPGFVVIERTPYFVRWQGEMKPYLTTYMVQIDYGIPLPPIAHTRFSPRPRARVIDPELEEHLDYQLGPIPHVYHGGLASTQPELCVYDPVGEEWSPEDLLAFTFLYWVARWLMTYEGWLATKRWHGKGRHNVTRGSRFDRFSGAPRRWNDRWRSTASDLALRATVPYPFDRRRGDKGYLSSFRFDRFRA